MSDWDDKIIAEFRENDGTVGGPFEGAKLLLLTTVGAKSDQLRVSPMMYFPEGDKRIVVASKGGAPENPAWYHNLKKNPAVHVEAATADGIEEYDAIASVLSLDDRDAKYPEIVAVAPGFGDYEKKTDRKIPLVLLTPVV